MHFDALSFSAAPGPCELGQTRGGAAHGLRDRERYNVSDASISRPFPEIYSEGSGSVTERLGRWAFVLSFRLGGASGNLFETKMHL